MGVELQGPSSSQPDAWFWSLYNGVHIPGLELNTASTSQPPAQTTGHSLGHFGVHFKEVEVGMGKTGDEVGIEDTETPPQPSRLPFFLGLRNP